MGGFPLMNSRFWRSMMDCGNDGGRVPRPVFPKRSVTVSGGGNSLSRKGKYVEVSNYQRCRPARVANRSWSLKRVGMHGRGKEQ
jgi:hypothetical protein